MVYTARTIVIGMTGKDPFMGFVLASKSLKNRRLEIRKSDDAEKIYVFPAKGYEIDNINYPEVDNYACIINQPIRLTDSADPSLKIRVLTGFNGHMAKRCNHNILDGMNPFLALDSTLFEFRGQKGDARIGGVIYQNPLRETSAYIGINDIDRMEKRVKKIELESNMAQYLCVTDTSKENIANIPKNISSTSLAEFIGKEMIPNLENLISTGVCILRKEGADLAVCNMFK